MSRTAQPVLAIPKVTSLQCLKGPQPIICFPVHSLFQSVLYSHCPNPKKVFTPPKCFAQQYLIEEFLKKWPIPIVDQAHFCLKKILNVSVNDILVLKVLVAKSLKAYSNALFSLTGPDLQLAIATMSHCQALANCILDLI